VYSCLVFRLFGLGAGLGGPLGGFINDYFGWCVVSDLTCLFLDGVVGDGRLCFRLAGCAPIVAPY
jgi:hypothetical protein